MEEKAKKIVRENIYKIAIFDIDGTLLDSTEFIFQAFEYTLKAHNLSKTRDEITLLAGKHLKEMYSSLAPLYEFEKLMLTHAKFYKENLHLVKPYTSVIETLKRLKNAQIKIAAISNRFLAIPETLKQVGILPYIDLVISGNDVTNPKPHPEQIFKALNHFGFKPKDAVMIGDSPSDIFAGKNAKVKTIAVSYGFHGEKIKKLKPDYMVNNLSEINNIII